MDYWALEGSEPRPNQIKTLLWLEANKDKKYLFCELPVGAGKSPIGVTYAKWVNATNGNGYQASFIMTPQKILQTQYEKSFMGEDVRESFMQSMYGQSNYKCTEKKTTCNIGALLKPRCSNCPYQNAKKLAIAAKHVIFNYALALTAFQYTDSFAPRNVIVFDEAHNIENILTEYNNISITASSCEHNGIKLVKSREFEEVIEWIKYEYFPRMDDVLDQLTSDCEYLLTQQSSTLSREEVHQLQILYSLTEHLRLVHQFIITDIIKLQRQYVLTHDKDSIKFKFLFGRDNFRRILQKKADKFLFMSATIFDAIEMCRCLGIPENETAYMSVQSDFPAENRPVLYNPIMKMNYSWNNSENSSDRRKMIKAILNILVNHKDNHGIIHTGNYAIAQWLVEELQDNETHEILHHNIGSTDSRDTVLKLFTTAKQPTLLISPSITEGLDLFEEKARFAIFVKIPFGAMGDAWIKARMTISSHWYKIRTLTDVIQGCGRIVRSKDDWGVVYILDESWQHLYNQMKSFIPKWWKDGYISK
jgi:Rad3-related DNA helicase